MSYQALLARVVGRNIPFSVLLELTYRCNLDCFYCYNDLASTGTPLSVKQYLALFRDLRTLGTLNLTFSGGEPLAHPDFFTLGAAGRDQGFLIRVKTNGHALHGRLARRLREELDPYILEISLHGASPATHDRQTRVRGSFDRLMANLKGLARLGQRVQLNATLTAWNEAELEAMEGLAAGLACPCAGTSRSRPGTTGIPRPWRSPRPPRRWHGSGRSWPGGPARRATMGASRRPPGTSTAGRVPPGLRWTPGATSTHACSGASRRGTCTASR